MDNFDKTSLYSATIQMRAATRVGLLPQAGNLADGMQVIVNPLWRIQGGQDGTFDAYAGEWAMGLRQPVHQSVVWLPHGDLVDIMRLPDSAWQQYPLKTLERAQREGVVLPNTDIDYNAT